MSVQIGSVMAEISDNFSEISEANLCLPQKRYFRQRAHSNPIADHDIDFPVSPKDVDWSVYYPRHFLISSGDEREKNEQHLVPEVKFVDVGCGYGGLLVELSVLYPSTLILGMEIRTKVSSYVQSRIQALRAQNHEQYENVACIRTNAMKFIPNYFRKGQLSKMFFLFPDPHFKVKKHRWRIISPQLLAEYAYVLQVKGVIYTLTDVKELHEWMVKCLDEHPLFERIPDSELENDPVVEKLFESSEEGKKVTRNKGDKFLAVYQRNADPYYCEEIVHT